MRKTGKAAAFVVLAICILALSSCMLFFVPEPETRYDVVGNWRRYAGEWNSTITYYLKADGTYSYSNNQNGDLDSGEYIVDWSTHTITTIHKMNHSLDKQMTFFFDDYSTLILDGYEYTRL